jgi:hypothetical protein
LKRIFALAQGAFVVERRGKRNPLIARLCSNNFCAAEGSLFLPVESEFLYFSPSLPDQHYEGPESRRKNA